MKCNISISEAFKSIFKENNWAKKLLIGGVFTFLSAIFMNSYALIYLPIIPSKINSIVFFIAVGAIGIITYFLLTCLLFGYNLKYTHNIIHQNPIKLPSWIHFNDLFEKGAIWLGISIVYWIGVIIITIGLTAIFKIQIIFFISF